MFLIDTQITSHNCSHGSIHLTDRHEGRVDVCVNGLWTTVCGNGWDVNDATVICRSIGFNSTGSMNDYIFHLIFFS